MLGTDENRASTDLPERFSSLLTQQPVELWHNPVCIRTRFPV
jgi:hypothetical protein